MDTPMFTPQYPLPTAPFMGGPLDGGRMALCDDGERFSYTGLGCHGTHQYAMVGRRWLYLGVEYGGDESISGI